MEDQSKSFKPFVSPDTKMPEFTLGPILVGVVLGIVFGASSLYLALKVGMTVSASIPISVLSITLFKWFSKAFKIRETTILENNIVQTTGSAGESIAFGVAVTMPALLILGYELDVTRIVCVAVLGSILGILMMIPLRFALIVKEHGTLKYPEGTACAQVLTAGEVGGSNAKLVFTGFFAALAYQVLNKGFKLWNEAAEKTIGWFKGSVLAVEVAPELLGIGYIVGPKTGCIMAAGGILSSLVLIPMIKIIGGGLTTPLFPGTKIISQMSNHEIWKSYILYIGAGAVAMGGFISLLRSIPTIYQGAKAGLRGFSVKNNLGLKRTEIDLPMPFVLAGLIGLILAIWFAPPLQMNLVGALLIVVCGFLFVTVSSRIAGEIGMSAAPISGMTVATLLFTSLVFLSLGWVEPVYRVIALSVAAIVCIASSNAGATSQDLKTGYLVGGTPKYQQIAIMIGSLTSALVIGYTLKLLNDSSTIYSKKSFPAGFKVPVAVSELTEKATVTGNDPVYGTDTKEYFVYRLAEKTAEGPLAALEAGKYLVDETGSIQYFVDPGVNGILKTRDDGSTVPKYEAPKARLMSFIIDGILNQKLPWGLILLGFAIALVFELCGVSSLPFAVGVYLPLATSAPIFFGGLVRYFVGLFSKSKQENEDSSPGALFATGLIAGGSIAGIVLALIAVRPSIANLMDMSRAYPALLESNLTPALAFGALMFWLFMVGKKKAA